MKKFNVLYLLSFLVLIISCSSDDSSEPETKTPKGTEWKLIQKTINNGTINIVLSDCEKKSTITLFDENKSFFETLFLNSEDDPARNSCEKDSYSGIWTGTKENGIILAYTEEDADDGLTFTGEFSGDNLAITLKDGNYIETNLYTKAITQTTEP